MAELELIPVHTRILTNKDNIVEIGRASVGEECRSRWAPYH